MTSKSAQPCISPIAHAVRFAAFAFAAAVCILITAVFPASAQASESLAVIHLSDDGTAADYPGVYLDGSVLTITLPGEYLLDGTLSNGRIVVDCEQTGKVRLFFSGLSVHCENGPALHIKKCSPRLTIELVGNTINELSDGAVYTVEDDKIDGVIYSKSDLTITGTGTLNVKGAYRDGIVSRDDLRLKGGIISVEAAHNGICGKDCVEIFDGEITVRADNDGIKSTNDDPDCGYISMEGGAVSITCGDDALSYVHALTITGGSVSVILEASKD